MTILDAIILGLVEGITEYLPVSSTGHLVLTAWLLGLDQPDNIKRAVDALLIVIQGGGILAVLGLYATRIRQMLRGLAGKDEQGRHLLIAIIVAFLPAAILGVLLESWIESLLMKPGPVIIALAVGGVVMIIVGRGPRRKSDHSGPNDVVDINYKSAFIIGLAQCLAMIPGMSRSMVTLVAGMLCGLRPIHAAEFSFLLGLPTLGGACVYKLLGNLMEPGPNLFQTLGTLPIIVGFVTATIAAALAITWLVAYLNRHGLAIFGWYRIVLAIVMFILILS
jgi:undecaprenyl-diphosphatase